MRGVNGKKAFLFVSFGVASASARHASLDACAEAIRHAFPDYLVCQAYTSQFMRKRLRAEGVLVPSVEEALEDLRKRGVARVVLQPSHLAPGEEVTGGVHVYRDMAGNEPASWKSRLLAAGCSVRTDLHALGERAAIREQFVRSIRALLASDK